MWKSVLWAPMSSGLEWPAHWKWEGKKFEQTVAVKMWPSSKATKGRMVKFYAKLYAWIFFKRYVLNSSKLQIKLYLNNGNSHYRWNKICNNVIHFVYFRIAWNFGQLSGKMKRQVETKEKGSTFLSRKICEGFLMLFSSFVQTKKPIFQNYFESMTTRLRRWW